MNSTEFIGIYDQYHKWSSECFTESPEMTLALLDADEAFDALKSLISATADAVEIAADPNNYHDQVRVSGGMRP